MVGYRALIYLTNAAEKGISIVPFLTNINKAEPQSFSIKIDVVSWTYFLKTCCKILLIFFLKKRYHPPEKAKKWQTSQNKQDLNIRTNLQWRQLHTKINQNTAQNSTVRFKFQLFCPDFRLEMRVFCLFPFNNYEKDLKVWKLTSWKGGEKGNKKPKVISP